MMPAERETTEVDVLLGVRALAALMEVSTDTVLRMARNQIDDFPQPIDIGIRAFRWRAKDYNAWLRRQAAKNKRKEP